MAAIIQPHLFSWQDVEAESDLNRLQLVLNNLPDEEVVSSLEMKRANGCNTYPIRPTWNAVLAGVVFQHPTVESLLRELRRNGQLRDACGFNPLLGANAVPSEAAPQTGCRMLSVVRRSLASRESRVESPEFPPPPSGPFSLRTFGATCERGNARVRGREGELSTLNSQLSTLNSQLSTLDSFVKMLPYLAP